MSFEEAATALVDPDAIFLADDSGDEERLVAIGMSRQSRVLFVVHVIRGERDRIISARVATSAEARVLGRGLRKDRKLPLRVLREAASKTQEEIASASGMDQSEISRVEKRDDLRLSTLRRYAKALDAEIEIVAVLPTGHRIKLDL